MSQRDPGKRIGKKNKGKSLRDRERYHEITVSNRKSCLAKKSNSNHWFVTFEYESRIDLQPDEKVKIMCNSVMVPCKILSARRPSEMNKHRNLGLFIPEETRTQPLPAGNADNSSVRGIKRSRLS